ncbi:MAG: aminotransferase class I/II-fold pyridoxal phosphate-dependent enzyme [Deltaproteobacteria bacterium]|nr:aminotransferase class I/II-fold pyridoxal phosphate-dependent enzyme [Deltaproteobacteria bacterium]
MDLFEPCYEWHDAELVKAAGVYPYFRVLSASEGPVVTVDGRPVVMLGSNNYLGLTHHPAVLRAAHDAIDRYGTGCTGSRFLNGNIELHESLERELAEFTGKEAALVFSSGFLANFGVLGLLGATEGCVLFSEAGNHASLIDGTRLSRAEVHVFDGPDDLAGQLSTQPEWRHALVVTDAVFSMTGKVVDLKRLVELRRKHHFRLYVDDAHGFGVLGRQGRGVTDALGVTPEVDLLFATFSKSLASLGGFVAGERPVIDYLRHKVRTVIFSAALPPPSAAAALAALRVMREDGSLFERLWENVHFFREGVEKLGYYTMGSTTPIVPLFVGSESLAFRLCRDALQMGVFATPAIFPAVPLGQALMRTSVIPAHTRAQLKKALEVFATLMDRYPVLRVDSTHLPTAEEMDFSYLFEQSA